MNFTSTTFTLEVLVTTHKCILKNSNFEMINFEIINFSNGKENR